MIKYLLIALILLLLSGCVMVPYDGEADGYYGRVQYQYHYYDRDYDRGSHHGGDYYRYSDHRRAGHQW